MRSSVFQIANSLTVSRLVAYLKLSDWMVADTVNRDWDVFVQANTSGEEGVEIALPKAERASGMNQYVAAALRTLAASRNEEIKKVESRIRFVGQDLIYIRNLDTDATNSVPLDLASIQIPKLKKLVGYAASAEKEARPHYDQLLSLGKTFVKDFRFGQTFEGSLGYTIESRPLGESITSFSMFEEEEEGTITILPPERRVVERILRGVHIADQAFEAGDVGAIVDNFESGLNSNMCEAISSLSNMGSMRLGVSVQWSPKAEASEDLSEKEVEVHNGHVQMLNVAAEELRRTQSRLVEVIGHVVGLTSAENPMTQGRSPKTAIIRWENRPDGRPVKIAVNLPPEQYQVATNAHARWTKVRFEGTVQKMGIHWIANDVSNFSSN